MTVVPNIVSDNTSPIIGLQQQLNQIRTQSSEYSQHDKNVTGFNNEGPGSSDEMKLYVPVETFDSGNRNQNRNRNVRIVNLFAFIFMFIIIFIFIVQLR